ncbi:MAG: DNA (cytosine-5-)-methyltransferase [Akkermansia sp.]|nr:DNA (cytosine-5-)-methyltransferase [Akkermansia sp.]
MKLLSELRKELTDIVKNDSFLKDHINETEAIVSHFLQNISGEIPLLPKHKQAELLLHLNKKTNDDYDLFLGEASDELPNIEVPDLFNSLPYPPPKKWNFTFIDLFAGIGGFRQAFQEAGGKCVFSSEWNKYAQKTYLANYGEIPYGDIREIPKEQIPTHDVLCAGFPCQPFSLAGVSKKNSLGRKHGFEDETQGTLFFEIKEILRLKRPKAFMLENVKNILSHDKGRTFEIIRRSLVDELGYVINYKIVNGAAWVPQHRERIYIIGFDPKQVSINQEEIIIPEKPATDYIYPKLSDIIKKQLEGYTLGPGTWATLERHKAHHEKAGNGFGYGLLKWPLKDDEVTRTISARYHKDGAEILVEQIGQRPRKLSVEEAMQLQGYKPEKFIFPVSATQAYTQIGNSVVVPAVAASAKILAQIIQTKSL